MSVPGAHLIYGNFINGNTIKFLNFIAGVSDDVKCAHAYRDKGLINGTKGSFNRYITHLGGMEGIDFCYGALRKLRYGPLQGGRV